LFQLLKFALAKVIPDFVESDGCFDGSNVDKDRTDKSDVDKLVEPEQV
jgi:hypothetical protein